MCLVRSIGNSPRSERYVDSPPTCPTMRTIASCEDADEDDRDGDAHGWPDEDDAEGGWGVGEGRAGQGHEGGRRRGGGS